MTRFVPIRWLEGAVTAAAVALLGSCGGDGSGTQPLSITAASPPAGTTGVAYPGYTFTASGGAPPLSWTESGSLPPGLMLSSSGQLSGNPVTAGPYPISVTVSDSSTPPLTASAPVSLKVNDSQIVIAAAPGPPPGTVCYPYPGFGFSASGGSPPYTWQWSGTPPPGLMLGSEGTVSGTPTQAGSFSFSVTATDSAQPPMSGPPLATQILVNNPSTLTLNATPAPSAGVEGTPYGAFRFSTTGGCVPLHWSITGGSLPPGLTLGSDGLLSGTPTLVGTFPFTVTVRDSAPTPEVSSQPFTIMVAVPPPPTINNSEPPTGTVGSVYTPFRFTANGGLAPLVWSETPPLTVGLSLAPDGVLSGTPTAAGQFPIALDVIDALSRSAPPLPVTVRVSLPHPGSFTVLPALMTIPRSGHSATLLNTGKVLVAGGGNGAADATAELYDPATGTFTATVGQMTQARIRQTATLLNDSALPNYGKVLVVGSVGTTAELYNPATGTFTVTGSMTHARASPTATLLYPTTTALNKGKVLIVGGNTVVGDLVAELYDPATGAFTDTGSTTMARPGHTATLLLDGRVLVAGGGSATAELYDPATGKFTPTGSMTGARSGHTATLLGSQDGTQNGSVLVVGTDGSADLFDPSKGTFAAVGSLLASMRGYLQRTASLRNDGTVLVAGGVVTFSGTGPPPPFCQGGSRSTSLAALLAPESDGFTATGALSTARDGHTATVLSDGAVLIAGGTRHTETVPPWRFRCPTFTTTVLSSAELFR